MFVPPFFSLEIIVLMQSKMTSHAKNNNYVINIIFF